MERGRYRGGLQGKQAIDEIGHEADAGEHDGNYKVIRYRPGRRHAFASHFAKAL